MRKADVVIGQRYQTRLSLIWQTVLIVARIELETPPGKRARVVFSCLTWAHRFVRRSAQSLRKVGP